MTAEPAFAALFAYLLQGSSLTPIGWVGAALIMVAVFIVEILPKFGFGTERGRVAEGTDAQ